FGLGEGKVDSVEVFWKNRKASILINPAINQIHEIAEAEAGERRWIENLVLEQFTQIGAFPAENEASLPNDFKRQSQLLYGLSQHKVSLIEADLNADDSTEVII